MDNNNPDNPENPSSSSGEQQDSLRDQVLALNTAGLELAFEVRLERRTKLDDDLGIF